MPMGRPKTPLLLDPEEHAQLQAVARSRSLPMVWCCGPKHPAQRVGNEQPNHRRHRHQEYMHFLREIDTQVPAQFAVHLIVDNYATHKHPRVLRWLAAHARFQVHYTQTYASWLNQVEIWFNIITQQAIRRGTFGSVKDLVTKIEHFVQHYNTHAQPFPGWP